MSTLKLKLSQKALIPQDVDVGVKMTRKANPTVVEGEECCFPCFVDFIADGDLTRVVEDPIAPFRAIFEWPLGEEAWSGTISVDGDLCDYEGEFHAQWNPPGEFEGSPPTFTYGSDSVGPTITISGSSEHDLGSVTIWMTVTHPEDDECEFMMGPLIASYAATEPSILTEWLMFEQAFPDITFDNYSLNTGCEISWPGVCLILHTPAEPEIDYASFSWNVGAYNASVFNISESVDGEGRPMLCISLIPDPGTDPGQLCDYIGETFTFNPTYDADGAGPNPPVDVEMPVSVTIGA